MQGANKRLVRNSESTLTLTSRSRTPAVPEERIAKHLSERAPTATGSHVYIHIQLLGMRQELGLVRSGASQSAS